MTGAEVELMVIGRKGLHAVNGGYWKKHALDLYFRLLPLLWISRESGEG